MFVTKALVIAVALSTCACASNLKQEVIQNILIGGAVGAVIGAAQSDHQAAYAIMYGGTLAAASGLATAYFSKKSNEDAKLRTENEELKKQLDEAFAPKVVGEAPGTLSGKIPAKYKNLVQPGSWQLSEIDQWVEDDENHMVHQDKIMELIPPTLIPKSQRVNKKESP